MPSKAIVASFFSVYHSDFVWSLWTKYFSIWAFQQNISYNKFVYSEEQNEIFQLL